MRHERVGIFEGGPPAVYVGSYGTRACLRADALASLDKRVLVQRYRKRGRAGFMVDLILTRFDFNVDAVIDDVARFCAANVGMSIQKLRFGPHGDESIEIYNIPIPMADRLLDVVLEGCQRTRRASCTPRSAPPVLQSA